MTMVAAQARQAQAIGLGQAHLGLLHPRQELAHARIAPGRVEEDFHNRCRRGLQANADGVEAEQDSGARHGRDYRGWLSRTCLCSPGAPG